MKVDISKDLNDIVLIEKIKKTKRSYPFLKKATVEIKKNPLNNNNNK